MKIYYSRAQEMAQQAKVPTIKPDCLDSIPWNQVLEGKNELPWKFHVHKEEQLSMYTCK